MFNFRALLVMKVYHCYQRLERHLDRVLGCILLEELHLSQQPSLTFLHHLFRVHQHLRMHKQHRGA